MGGTRTAGRESWCRGPRNGHCQGRKIIHLSIGGSVSVGRPVKKKLVRPFVAASLSNAPRRERTGGSGWGGRSRKGERRRSRERAPPALPSEEISWACRRRRRSRPEGA